MSAANARLSAPAAWGTPKKPTSSNDAPSRRPPRTRPLAMSLPDASPPTVNAEMESAKIKVIPDMGHANSALRGASKTEYA